MAGRYQGSHLFDDGRGCVEVIWQFNGLVLANLPISTLPISILPRSWRCCRTIQHKQRSLPKRKGGVRFARAQHLEARRG